MLWALFAFVVLMSEFCEGTQNLGEDTGVLQCPTFSQPSQPSSAQLNLTQSGEKEKDRQREGDGDIKIPRTERSSLHSPSPTVTPGHRSTGQRCHHAGGRTLSLYLEPLDPASN